VYIVSEYCSSRSEIFDGQCTNPTFTKPLLIYSSLHDPTIGSLLPLQICNGYTKRTTPLSGDGGEAVGLGTVSLSRYPSHSPKSAEVGYSQSMK
jgi:hypothetical protein